MPLLSVAWWLPAEKVPLQTGPGVGDKVPTRLPMPPPPCVQRWAGPDQAQALSLCEWLFHRVESLEPFMPAGGVPAAGGQALGSIHPAGLHATALLFVYSRALICPPCLLQAGQERAEHVLRALAAAAEAVQQGEFVLHHGAWVEAHQQLLPAAVVAFWQQAQQVGRLGGVEMQCRPTPGGLGWAESQFVGDCSQCGESCQLLQQAVVQPTTCFCNLCCR